MKERIDKLDFIKLKTSVQWKTMSGEWEDAPHNGRKYLQKIDLKKNCWGFPGGTMIKNLPANAGDTGLSPGPGRSHMPRSN